MFITTALAKDIIITAEKLEYQDRQIRSDRNVEVNVDNMLFFLSNLRSNEDEIYTKKDFFSLMPKRQMLMGDSLSYLPKQQKYSGHNLILKTNKNNILTSSKINIDKSKIQLSCASFTSCPVSTKTPPIWSIHSSEATLDKSSHMLKLKFPVFKIYSIPVFALPYIIYPTHKAEARSGLLLPYIRNSAIHTPLYTRITNNCDLTYTPSFGKMGITNKFDYRYITSLGQYNVTAAINSPFSSKYHYLNSKGAFKWDSINMKYNIVQSNNDEYYELYNKNIYYPYMLSDAALSKTHDKGFIDISSKHFKSRNGGSNLSVPISINATQYYIPEKYPDLLFIRSRIENTNNKDKFDINFGLSKTDYLSGNIINLKLNNNIDLLKERFSPDFHISIKRPYVATNNFMFLPEIKANFGKKVIKKYNPKNLDRNNITPSINALYLNQDIKLLSSLGYIKYFDGRNKAVKTKLGAYSKNTSIYWSHYNYADEYINNMNIIGSSITYNKLGLKNKLALLKDAAHISGKISYQIDDNIAVSYFGIRSLIKKPYVLEDKIKLTFLADCIKISLKLKKYFSKKTQSEQFSISLGANLIGIDL